MATQFKSFDFMADDVSADGGTVTGYASTFTREPDSYGDVIAKGAFAETLDKWAERNAQGRFIPLLWDHDTNRPESNLGRVIRAEEDDHGLLITAELDAESERAQYVRRLLKQGRVYQFSFAYAVMDQAPVELVDGTKANELRKLDLFEVSVVPIPANQYAEVVEVKDATATGAKSGTDEGDKVEQARLDAYKHAYLATTHTSSHERRATMPTLTEQRDQLLNDLKDAKTMEDVATIGAKLADVNAKIKHAEEGQSLLKALAPEHPVSIPVGDNPAYLTAGEHFAAHFAKSVTPEMKRKQFTYTAPTFYKTDPAPHVTPGAGSYGDALTEVHPDIVEGYRAPTVVGDLFNGDIVEQGNSVTWFSESTTITGGPAVIAEGTQKPMVQFADPVEHVSKLVKVAGYHKLSTELLDDAPRLAENINRRALYQHDLVEAGQYLSGTGSSGQMTGLLNTSGIQVKTYANGGSINFDVILEALGAVTTDTGLMADAILLAPADYYALLGTKDANLQYLAGGPVFGPYGNGTVQPKPAFWGTPVYTTPLLTAGTAVVGAFKLGGTVYRKPGVTVSLFNQNEDDAIKNLVTVIVESRSILAVERPSAFVKITEASE